MIQWERERKNERDTSGSGVDSKQRGSGKWRGESDSGGEPGMWEATGPVRRTLVAIWIGDGTSESESSAWGRRGKRSEAEGSPAWGREASGVRQRGHRREAKGASDMRQRGGVTVRPKRCSFVICGTGPKSVQSLRVTVLMVEPPVSGFWPIFLKFWFFQRTGLDEGPVPGWTDRSGPFFKTIAERATIALYPHKKKWFPFISPQQKNNEMR